MTTATAVAEYLIGLGTDPRLSAEEADLLSHRRVQCLLYYVQGYALVLLEGPAFADETRARAGGPEVPAVADRYRHLGPQVIPPTEANDGSALPPLVKSMAEMVWAGFGKHSSGELARLTKADGPWASARAADAAEPVIPHAALRERFVERVAADVKAIPYPVPDPVLAWRGEAEDLAGDTRPLADAVADLTRRLPAPVGR